MKAIRIHEVGGPEAMRLEELPDPAPGKGDALVAVEASGVNFIDVYHRTGLYKTALPLTLGQEGAGGVGLLLTQIATRLGATVLGTVGSEAKAKLAREAGAVRTVDYTKEDFVAAAKELTGGRGVQVAYDSVGRTTFDGSLASL